MAITKAEIMAHLNSELYRTETDIDAHILGAMKDISIQDDFVWVESTVPTIVGRTYYSVPVDCKGMRIKTIKMDDSKPLSKATWSDYQKAIADQTSSDYAEPLCYALNGGFWYAYPTPDAIYSATLFYPAFVAESRTVDEVDTNAVDEIDHFYSDIFRDALYSKTKALYCLSKEMKDEAAMYQTVYENLNLPLLKKMVKREPHFVRCQDV